MKGRAAGRAPRPPSHARPPRNRRARPRRARQPGAAVSAHHFSLAGRASLGTARQFAEVTAGVLRSWRVPEARVLALELAVSEMATNVCRHGYEGKEQGQMRLELDWDASGLRIALADSGRPFDPKVVATVIEPDPADPATWPERGLGLEFIRAAGRVDYRSDEKGNVFSLLVEEPLR